MSGRDHQRARLYAWEDAVVAPLDASVIAFVRAQGMVDAIWAEAGLRFPPRVERLPRQARTRQADATRLCVRLSDPVPSWVLLHELAHAMTSTQDGASDGHGAMFAGVYVGLLTRYLRLDRLALARSLVAAGVVVDLEARPVFLDPDGVSSTGVARATCR